MTSNPVIQSRSAAARELLIVFAAFLATRAVLELTDWAWRGPTSTVVAVTAIALLHWRGGLSTPLGLLRPPARLKATGVTLLAIVATALIGLFVLPRLVEAFGSHAGGSDRFAFLEGDLAATIITVITVAWFAAAFGEEVLFRGFLLPRLASLLGGGTGAWLLAILLGAVIFGALHGSLAGQITAGLIGAVYGLIYWRFGRNLWPLIVAHAVPDTISLIGSY